MPSFQTQSIFLLFPTIRVKRLYGRGCKILKVKYIVRPDLILLQSPRFWDNRKRSPVKRPEETERKVGITHKFGHFFQ